MTDDIIPPVESGEIPFIEKSELEAVFDNVDRDDFDSDKGTNSLDLNTRLSDDHITSMLIFDEFQGMGFFDKDISLTRRMKRMLISKNGLGRQEKVSMVVGLREGRSQGGFMGWLKGRFSRQDGGL